MTRIIAKQVISASWVIPVVPHDRVLEDCALIINEGKIENILPVSSLAQQYEVEQHLHLDGQVLMPGLFNCHGHSAMALLRGYADDIQLMPWLQDHIWPAEAKWVNAQFVRDGTQLAIAEMLMSGVTCFSDMYFFPETAAEVVHEAGLKAQIAFPVIDFPTNWSTGAEDCLNKGLVLHDTYRSHPRVNIAFGPHAPYTVSDEPLKKIATYAEELQKPVQIHLHETAFEVEESLQQHQKRPLQRLHDLGLLSPLLQCVHMTQINEDDLELLKQTGAHVVHCPDSNLKLASGISPISTLLDSGVNVALGTDGAASNNDLNVFEEMQQAALLAKAQSGDASVLNAHQAIRMATINGAKALGMESETGSLEIGKAADICAVDLRALHMQPIYNPVSQIVYNGAGNQISHVWVNGRALLENHKLTTLSEDKIRSAVNGWKKRIAND